MMGTVTVKPKFFFTAVVLGGVTEALRTRSHRDAVDTKIVIGDCGLHPDFG